jgi:hypothetical protein
MLGRWYCIALGQVSPWAQDASIGARIALHSLAVKVSYSIFDQGWFCSKRVGMLSEYVPMDGGGRSNLFYRGLFGMSRYGMVPAGLRHRLAFPI